MTVPDLLLEHSYEYDGDCGVYYGCACDAEGTENREVWAAHVADILAAVSAAAPDVSRVLPDGTYVLTVADGRSSVTPAALDEQALDDVLHSLGIDGSALSGVGGTVAETITRAALAARPGPTAPLVDLSPATAPVVSGADPHLTRGLLPRANERTDQ